MNKKQRFEITEYPWADENGYKPKTDVTLTYDDEGYTVYFKSYETPLRMKETEHNTAVFLDSCVEFFVQFDPENDETYINFEMNPNCAVTCRRGFGRKKAAFPNEVIDTFGRRVEIHGEYWEAWIKIPLSFIKENYSAYKHEEGHVIRANFYKCGNNEVHEHYGCWKRIEAEKPNFHSPEFFGEIVL